MQQKINEVQRTFAHVNPAPASGANRHSGPREVRSVRGTWPDAGGRAGHRGMAGRRGLRQEARTRKKRLNQPPLDPCLDTTRSMCSLCRVAGFPGKPSRRAMSPCGCGRGEGPRSPVHPTGASTVCPEVAPWGRAHDLSWLHASRPLSVHLPPVLRVPPTSRPPASVATLVSGLLWGRWRWDLGGMESEVGQETIQRHTGL